MTSINNLNVKIFADGADLDNMSLMNQVPYISGFTTNPTLMRKAGVVDYVGFAQKLLQDITNKPICFEVFSDEFAEMLEQAKRIASWGKNVFVKIPVTNTKGESTVAVIKALAALGIKQNVTAVMTIDQVHAVAEALREGPASFISIFAGRIADTGRDPVPIMQAAVSYLTDFANIELIWASPREVLNIFQANEIGCHVITVTGELLNKLGSVGKDLADFSLETVKMFHSDASLAEYAL